MVLGQILAFSVLLLALWFWKNWRLILASWNLPGPFALPPLGSVFTYHMLLNIDDVLKNLTELAYTYQSKFKFWLGPIFVVFIQDAEEVKSFYLSKFTTTKCFIFKNWGDIMGNGLLTLSGEPWRQHRRLANPYFLNGKLLKSYQTIAVKQSKVLVKILEQFCDKEPIDVLLHATRCSGDILGEAIFKVPPSFQSGDNDKYIYAVDDVAETSLQRMCQIWLQPKWIFNLSKCGKRANLANSMIREYSAFVIKENQENAKKENDSEDVGVVGAMLRDLEEGNCIKSMEEIAEEIQTLFAAGMDTVGTIEAFFMLMLAIHKEKQNNLFDEIKQYYGDDLDKDVDQSDLVKLQYLDWCFKETCRLFPVAFVTVRDLDDDLHIKTAQSDYVIPYGSTVIVSNYLLHRDKSLWSKPEEYNPERFSPELSKNRHSFSFLPYNAGPRQCIGLKFGADSVKTMIIYILRRYELHSDWRLEDIPLGADVSIRSRWGYKIKLTKRLY